MPFRKKQRNFQLNCFYSILNRTGPVPMAGIPPAAVDLVICIDPLTLEGVKAAIRAMKSAKAGGANRVTAEILKAEETETPRILTDRFMRRERRNALSNSLRRVTWKQLETAGEATLCSQLPARSLARSFTQDWRLQWTSTSDRNTQVFAWTLIPWTHLHPEQILEQSKQRNTPLYVNFVDLEKVFDSIHRDSLWKISWHYRISSKLWM